MGAPYIMDMLDALKKSSDQNKDIANELSKKTDTAIQINSIQNIVYQPSESGYLKIAEITTNGYGNKAILLQISTPYATTNKTRIDDGIIFINIRGDTDTATVTKFMWLGCSGLNNGGLFYARKGKTIEFYRKVMKGEYSSVTLKCLDIGNFENGIIWSFKLIPVARVASTPLDTPIGELVEISPNDYIADELAKKADTTHTHTIADITNMSNATQSANGLMSSSDKKKLDNVEDGAQKNVINVITVNGSKIEPQNGTVDLSIEDNDKLPLSGGEVTGNVQQSGASTDYSTYKFRNISFGTSSTPSSDATHGGSGSVYFMYT